MVCDLLRLLVSGGVDLVLVLFFLTFGPKLGFEQHSVALGLFRLYRNRSEAEPVSTA